MPLYRLSELLPFLESIGAKPKKGLSQNFLIDGNIVAKILQAADVRPGDFILEIGSGPGVLTEALLHAGAQVLAVEKDAVFAENLKRFKGLSVYAGDILEFPFDEVKKKAKVVSNLPYHLTTPILSRLVPRKDLFSTITVMVQEEVARRMTARAGTRDYSSLTVFLNFYSTPRYAFKVDRKCFYPRPNVDSAVVSLPLKDPPPVDEEKFFFFVRTAFQQRRKMLRSSLSKLAASQTIEETLIQLGLNPKARPEELPLQALLDLYSKIHHI